MDEMKEIEPLDRICEFYDGASVFMTGATGFLGKLLVEKMLHSCPGINKIMLLMRSKKGKNAEERFQEIFSQPIFERLKKEQPKFLEKIEIVNGDCTQPSLGLNETDRRKIIREANIVLHVAAVVRFDEKISIAAAINVRATKDLLAICQEIKELKAMVHVSTAYSNCITDEIYEKFYDSPMKGDKLLQLVDSLNDEILDNITPTLLQTYPNTYTFTKAIAEDVIKDFGKGLPIAIVRPSIVVSTAFEPVAGWIDNFYGPTGAVAGTALGILRTMHCSKDKITDIVPADLVVNAIICAAWNASTTAVAAKLKESDAEEKIEQEDAKIPIFNLVSSNRNPINWGTYLDMCTESGKKVPSKVVLWHHVMVMCSSSFFYNFCKFFLHFIPALLIDFVLCATGKPQIMRNVYKKIHKFCSVTSFFATKQWFFGEENLRRLWSSLSATEKSKFNFDIASYRWSSYFDNYMRGVRVFLFKDPMDTLKEGAVKMRRVYIAHCSLVTVLGLCLLRLAWSIGKIIFSMIF